MPHIYPLIGQRHHDLSRELTELGGEAQKTFRLAFAWDGEHFFEVIESPEGIALYEQWIATHNGEGAAAVTKTPVEPGEQGSPASSTPAGSVRADAPPPPDAPPLPQHLDDGPQEVEITTSQPALTDEKDAETQQKSVDEAKTGAAENVTENASEVTPSERSTTGTNRKRSAKNSTRRS